jgi:hypothetical protein
MEMIDLPSSQRRRRVRFSRTRLENLTVRGVGFWFRGVGIPSLLRQGKLNVACAVKRNTLLCMVEPANRATGFKMPAWRRRLAAAVILRGKRIQPRMKVIHDRVEPQKRAARNYEDGGGDSSKLRFALRLVSTL